MAKRTWLLVVLSNAAAGFIACSGSLPTDVGENNVADASSSTRLRDSSKEDSALQDQALPPDDVAPPEDVADTGLPVDDGATDSASSDALAIDGAAQDATFDATDALVDAKPDVVFSFDAGAQSDGGLAADAACAQASAAAVAIPLDMYVMLDRSGSMGTDCNIGSTTSSKWCRAINALSSYFGSTDATGNAAAIQYFPLDSGGTCAGGGYSTAASPSSSFTSLPSSAFNTSLNAQTASGGTPMEGAIRGITTFTGAAANQRAGRKLIGVLITDGDPNGCDNNISNLAGVLSSHYANTGHETFVVGMTGATFTSLETLAVGGGAPLHNDAVGTLTNACGTTGSTCRHWNAGDGNGNALAEAMKQIQKSAVACTYAMPKSDAGIIDPNQVKVEYRPGGTGSPQTFSKVTGPASCTSAGGFYYDNNTSPTLMTLCPTSCTTVQADAAAKVDILLGCLGS